MRVSWRQFVMLVVLAGALVSHCAAQIALGDAVHVSGNGDATLGFNDTFGDDGARQLAFGLNSSFNGYYYHPNFLTFHIAPYYNQTRLNSDAASSVSGKGFSASAGLFSGSHMPIDLSFDKTFSSESSTNVMGGTNGFVTEGSSQSFNVDWHLNLDNLPTFQVGYGITDGSSNLFGTDREQENGSRVFRAGVGYRFLGFTSNANYVRSNTSSDTPYLLDLSQTLHADSFDETKQVSLSRPLPLNSSFNAQYSRTNYTSDFYGQSISSGFDSSSVSFTTMPIQRLSLGASLNYSSNAGSQLLASLLPSGDTSGGQTTVPLSAAGFGAHALIYDVNGSYAIMRNLSVNASFDRQSDTFAGETLSSDSVRGGLRWSHGILGGFLGAGWSIGKTMSSAPATSFEAAEDVSSIGQTGSMSYSRKFAGWRNTSNFSITRSDQSAVRGYTQSGYAFSESATRQIAGSQLSINGNISKTSVDGLSESDSLSESISGAITRGRVSLGGTFSKSSGSALQLFSGLQSSPIAGQLLMAPFLVQTSGSSFGVNASYAATRRLRLFGNYSHASYEATSAASNSGNFLNRYSVQSDYLFRQMRIRAGVDHFTQGFASSLLKPVSVTAIYVGVSRHFDLF